MIVLYDKCSLRRKDLKPMNTVSMHAAIRQRRKEDFPEWIHSILLTQKTMTSTSSVFLEEVIL